MYKFYNQIIYKVPLQPDTIDSADVFGIFQKDFFYSDRLGSYFVKGDTPGPGFHRQPGPTSGPACVLLSSFKQYSRFVIEVSLWPPLRIDRTMALISNWLSLKGWRGLGARERARRKEGRKEALQVFTIREAKIRRLHESQSGLCWPKAFPLAFDWGNKKGWSRSSAEASAMERR